MPRPGRPLKHASNPLWLKQELARLGISQATLAQAVGVAQPVASAWLNGRCAPNPEHAAKLMELLADLGAE